MTNPGAIDAVSLSIMWDRLIGITDEIISALVRSSFSTIVRESGDLSVVVLDAEGNSVAQGSYSVPSFTGTAAPTLRHMLAKFPPESLAPGDVVATNDAWMGTGHLFDINVMRPVFREGRIAGYTMSITHLPDIGGLGFGAAASEIFHEGLRLPVCKLMRRGRLDEPMFDVIRSNVRVPEQVFGDLMANITCNEVGARQLLEFMDEYGLDDLAPLSAAIRGQSERAIRERIAALPDGSYEGAIDIEGIDDPPAPRVPRRDRGPRNQPRLLRDFGPGRPRHQRTVLLYAGDGLLRGEVPDRARDAEQRGRGSPDPGERAGGFDPERAAAPPDGRAARDRPHGGPSRLPHARRSGPRAGAGGLRDAEHRHLPGRPPGRPSDVHHLLLDRGLRGPPGLRRGPTPSRGRRTCGRFRSRCGNP